MPMRGFEIRYTDPLHPFKNAPYAPMIRKIVLLVGLYLLIRYIHRWRKK